MSTKKHTVLGSPCSPAWDARWIETVERAEKDAGRRLCGARTLDGTPCTLAPSHENGRCRYHGGFDLTGAQPGNRNAVIHGLYARGLQRCGAHCPRWESCPLPRLEAKEGAGDGCDIEHLPAHKRPTCPYEQAQHQSAVTDLVASLPQHASGYLQHLAQHTALLEVMTNRAAAAMAVTALVETSETREESPPTATSKPAAALTAFNRLAAEHRRTVGLYLQAVESDRRNRYRGTPEDVHLQRRTCDTALTPEAQEALFSAPSDVALRAEELTRSAERKLYEIGNLKERYLKEEGARDGGYGQRGVGSAGKANSPRTANGFAEERTEEAFMREVGDCRQEAMEYYRRAFRLAPDLYGAYAKNPDRAAYFRLLAPEEREGLAAMGNNEK